MTQLIRRNNTKSHHAKSNQFSAGIRINENRRAKELIYVNTDCHCATSP